MPITDNSFSGEELATALQANPELATTLTGFVTDQANAEAPWRKTLESKFVDPATAKFASGIETDVHALTGIQRKENEKYHDYMKRAFGETKSSYETKLQAATTELQTLKDKGGDVTAAERERMATLQKQLQTKEQEFNDYKTQTETKLQNTTKGADIDKGFAAARLKYNKEMPPEAIEAMEERVRAKLLSMGRIQDNGSIIYYKDDGTQELDTKGSYAPLDGTTLVERMMKSVMKDAEHIQTGGGTGGFDTKELDADGKNIIVPDTVKTRVQLMDFFKSKGVKEGTKQFDDLWKKATEKKNYPLQ